jgi:O-antigen ligase
VNTLALKPVDDPEPAQTSPASNIPWMLLACCWVLMLVSFSVPGRPDNVSAGTLDTIGLLKLGTRLGAFFFLLFLFVRSWHPERSRVVLKILAPAILFVAWGLLSVTWSPLKSVSLGQLSVWVVAVLLAANIGVLWRGPGDTSRLLGSVSGGLLFFCCFLIFLNYAAPQYGSLSRMGWGILHPTAAASLGGSGLVLLVAARLIWGWRWSRLQLLPGVVAYSWLLLLAQNRTSTVVTTIVVVGLFCLWSNRKLFLGLAVCGCMAAAAMLLVDPGQRSTEQITGQVGEHLSRGQKGRLTELSGRREMWDEIWRSHQKSPWIGHGYFVSSAEGQIYVWYTWGNWTAHNLWLQVLVGTGYVGLAFFIAGLAVPALCLSQNLTTPHTRRMACFAAAMITWYLGWGCFNESISGPMAPEVIVFFVTLGLVTATTASAAMRQPDAAWHGSMGCAGRRDLLGNEAL